MTNYTSTQKSYTKNNPCPVCGGYDSQARGKGLRCWGFATHHEGNDYATCSRTESPRSNKLGAWIHWLNGSCDCGGNHGDPIFNAVIDSVDSVTPKSTLVNFGNPITMTEINFEGFTYRHVRQNKIDNSTGETGKGYWWEGDKGSPSDNGHSPTQFPLHAPRGMYITAGDEVIVITEGQPAANAVWAAGHKALGLYGAECEPDDNVIVNQLQYCKTVILWADCDSAGRTCMNNLAFRIAKLLPHVKRYIFENPDGIPKSDADDLTRQQVDHHVTELINNPELALDNSSTRVVFGDKFPAPMDESAYLGILGDVVNILDHSTESDKQSNYLTLLSFIGLLIGPNTAIEAAIGHPELMTLLVGDTSTARKGTSWKVSYNQVLKPVMKELGYDDEEIAAFMINGVSSGEGLVSLFDPPVSAGAPKAANIQKFVKLSEFAMFLDTSKRQGNNVSIILRDFYDNEDVEVPTARVRALKAISPHLALLAHITPDEFADKFDQREATYGVLNRFFPMAVTGSKILPIERSTFPAGVLTGEIVEIARLIEEAQRHRDVRFTHDGADRYNEIRRQELDWAEQQGEVFIVKATSRVTDYVGKIAHIMAAMDFRSYSDLTREDSRTGRSIITAEHVDTAYKWCLRSRETVRWIFDDDDLTINEANVIQALRAADNQQLGRTEIRAKALNNKAKPSYLNKLAKDLSAKGWIEVDQKPSPKKKPTQVWTLIRDDEV